MKKIIATIFSSFFLLISATSTGLSSELERIQGEWSINKTNEEGQSYTQTIQIKESKFTFKIIDREGQLLLYAEGNIECEKLGPFKSIKFFSIASGASESELDPVDDDRTVIYKLGYNTWILATNFDKDRGEPPSIDIYNKVQY